MPDISIIVPVYNAEQTLRTCIDSILSQSCRNWELILIDDGSIDSSPMICDEYAARDSRIAVVHKMNGGVSSARNVGLDMASGKWITFIDADDYISKDYFNVINSNIVEDLVIVCNYHFLDDKLPLAYEPIDNLVATGMQQIKNFLRAYLHYHIMMVPWGKFYRRRIVNGLRFELGQRIGEDVIFNLYYFRHCRSLRLDNRAKYYYFQDSSDKYIMSITDSLLHLGNIFRAYKNLSVVSPQFCLFELNLFTKLSREYITQHPCYWYRTKLIHKLYAESKSLLSWKARMKFWIYNIPLGYTLYHKLWR